MKFDSRETAFRVKNGECCSSGHTRCSIVSRSHKIMGSFKGFIGISRMMQMRILSAFFFVATSWKTYSVRSDTVLILSSYLLTLSPIAMSIVHDGLITWVTLASSPNLKAAGNMPKLSSSVVSTSLTSLCNWMRFKLKEFLDCRWREIIDYK